MEKYETTKVAADHHGSSLRGFMLLGTRILWCMGLVFGAWKCMKYWEWLFQLRVAQCRGLGSSLSKGGEISVANFTIHLLFPQSALLEYASLSCQYLAVYSNKSSLL